MNIESLSEIEKELIQEEPAELPFEADEDTPFPCRCFTREYAKGYRGTCASL